MKTDSRLRLLQAAEKVTYRRGYGNAALAEIAEEARIPLGNVYYYFKTKDEIAEAIVERRVSRFRKQLEELDREGSPWESLCGFVQIKIDNRLGLARGGCPVGTLCSELRKAGGAAAKNVTILFETALDWMEQKFRAIGKGTESRAFAVHLLAATQGASVLAHTFHDPRLIDVESARLKEWIRSL